MATIRFVESSTIAAGFYNSIVLSKRSEAELLTDGQEAGGGHTATSLYSFGTNRNCLQAAEDRPVAKGQAQEGGKAHPRFSAEPLPLEQFSGHHIVQVSCGGNHCAAVQMNPGEEGGEVWMWGLGNGGRLGVERPKKMSELKRLLDRSLYPADRAAKLLSDKGYQRWIVSNDIPKWSLHMPMKVNFGLGVQIAQVSCGADFSLALTEKGAIFAWGIGSYGNLGTGLIMDQWQPVQVEVPDRQPCRQVAAGTKHSMALGTDGVMFSWGHGGHGRLGHGPSCDAKLLPTAIRIEGNPSFEYIAVGEAHSASIDFLGHVWCWGAGSFGRSGHGDEDDNMTPLQISSLGGQTCKQVALGVLHGLAVTRKGQLWSWGSYLCAGFGADDDQEAAAPLMDEALEGKIIVEVAAGNFHSLALTDHGEVFSWGSGSMGRLGLGALGPDMKNSDQPTPMQVMMTPDLPLIGWTRPRGATALQTASMFQLLPDYLRARAEASQVQCMVAGGMHSACIEKDGSCWLWGNGEYGQNASPEQKDFWKPVLLSPKMKVLNIALGLEHCLMTTTNMELYSWGRNQFGQLGHGTTDTICEPRQVTALAKANIVSAGEDHSVALTPLGETYTWGNSDSGKLGHGSNMLRSSMGYPKMLKMEQRMQQVACGQQHTAMIDTSGRLFTFGAGWYGRLGQGSMDNCYSPKRIEQVQKDEGVLRSAPSWLDVACGSFHTCSIDEKSQLWVWGRDHAILESDHVPIPCLFTQIEEPGVGWKVKVLKVSAGAAHTLCVTAEGNLWGWGDNSKGQLGLGKGSPSHVGEPMIITGKGWTSKAEQNSKQGFLMSVSCGHAHSMALVDTGEIWAWGLQCGGRLALIHQTEGKQCMVPHKVEHPWTMVDKSQLEDEDGIEDG
eukprot:TRINITY_DN4065_c0_g1_i1.p1 TRINITY_DN4065_c0_g1~~TRINITY_DN4065_c0_g1_i1.p1  ORF type:complete len:892 (-),score=176.46 TRINITY_DN4065_c0_g1_i1:172-2847(-)